VCVAKYGEAGVEQVAKVASGRTGPLVNHSPDDESQAPLCPTDRQTDDATSVARGCVVFLHFCTFERQSVLVLHANCSRKACWFLPTALQTSGDAQMFKLLRTGGGRAGAFLLCSLLTARV